MRLTKRLDDGQAVMDCENCELKQTNNCHLLLCRNRLKDQLAKYEDVSSNPDNLIPKAEWIHKENGEVVCSRCNSVHGIGAHLEEVVEGINFCSTCGADMRGGKNEST